MKSRDPIRCPAFHRPETKITIVRTDDEMGSVDPGCGLDLPSAGRSRDHFKVRFKGCQM